MSSATSYSHPATDELGDFTATPRMLFISALACGIGVLCAFVALALLRLIGLFTNLFFFQRIDTGLASPANGDLGLFILFVPVIGGLIVGVMARYGSERIRGHGIPEAIEAILINGSRIDPKVAVLKPVSAAISIGSGGPFGAEGPIIMTGGAIGSLIAQFIHLTSSERKTLLVAGAAGGMSATFSSPVAAVLLATELLLFEWKPRSMVPVALASGVAALVRHYIIAPGPIFPVPAHSAFIGPDGLAACVAVGVLAGMLSMALTVSVYAAEDAFGHLPIHWMWWPAIGGLLIGAGGLVFPEALGVGYDTIGGLVQGNTPMHILVGVLLVKSIIWASSLGSGTSGGVLAPLLMIGGALGGLEAHILPNEGLGFWPMISMGAILGGTMRSPFTGVVFMLELTQDVNALLPLLIAVTVAHAFTVLTLHRSILTEKVARRGYHLSREYAVDPLEILFVREVMRTEIVGLPLGVKIADLGLNPAGKDGRRMQHLYPIVDEERRVRGVVTRGELSAELENPDADSDGRKVDEIMQLRPTVAYPDEPLRVAVYRMAESGITRFPVITRKNGELVGMISLEDLLKARTRNLEAERRRERIIHFPRIFRWRRQARPMAGQ